MLNIGTGELIVIAVVALLVLGPQRLPELARGIGKFMREFRRQTDEVRGVVEREFYKMDQGVNAPPPVVPQPAPGLVTTTDPSNPSNPGPPGAVPPPLAAGPGMPHEGTEPPAPASMAPPADLAAVPQPAPADHPHDPPSAAADPVEIPEKKAS
jgi:sec-independent protein translocase protein TatB